MPVSIQGRFRRSINLARDFYGDHDLDGYIVTTKARELADRVGAALASPEAQRAWSVTGPYGGGKSAFALFLAHLLRGDDAALDRLAAADPGLAERFEEARGGAFCPVLVVGAREPIGPALLRGLAGALDHFADRYERRRGRPSQEVLAVRESLRTLAKEARDAAQDPSGTAAFPLFDRAAEAIHDVTSGGLVVVVDELGKLLEHAALYPEEGDLFILQQLAERASRSDAGEDTPPLLLFTILHQAFERYAGRLNQAQREEWQKVQGRFADVGFVEPVSETLRLLAHAVQVDDPEHLPERAGALAEQAAALGALPASVDPAWAREQLRAALPLHPAVSLLVGSLFRRLAQNERSLFAFLASGEPHGFLDGAYSATCSAA